MGTSDGSIIAAIITIHIPRNDAAAAGQVCPGIRIHVIDIVQPPGIVMSPIADIDEDQTVVSAAQTANSSAETPKNARSDDRSTLVVFIMAAPPDVGLIAAFWCAIEPLIHAPHAVDSARVGGIGVVDHSVLEREGTHARSFTHVRRRVRARHCGDFGDWALGAAQLPHGFAPVVVVDAPFPLLLLAE